MLALFFVGFRYYCFLFFLYTCFFGFFFLVKTAPQKFTVVVLKYAVQLYKTKQFWYYVVCAMTQTSTGHARYTAWHEVRLDPDAWQDYSHTRACMWSADDMTDESDSSIMSSVIWIVKKELWSINEIIIMIFVAVQYTFLYLAIYERFLCWNLPLTISKDLWSFLIFTWFVH